MGRKCSHCGKIGHNSRTCSNLKTSHSNDVVNRVRLFGVQLELYASSCSSTYSSSNALKKSFSMDCLPCSSLHTSSLSPFSSFSSPRASISEDSEKIGTGYISDGLLGHPEEKKKGVPWSREEHKAFLAGLEKLGKGDWRGISRNFVATRTPTQVASHAQKYFLRQVALNCKKRRASLFDMVSSDKLEDDHVNESNTKIIRSSRLEENYQNHVFSKPSFPDQATLSGPSDSFSSPNMNSSLVTITPTSEALNLELTLGASTPTNQDKSLSNTLLIGPITVV